jgi:phosphatidylinositol alpha-1,6-mannosyltransferase
MWSWPFKIIRLLFLAMGIIKKEKIEKVIIANILPTGIIGIFLKLFTAKPYILFTYGMDVFYPRSWVRRSVISLILKQAEKIIAISRYTRMCLTRFGVNIEKSFIITPATDCSYFQPGKDVSSIQDKYSVKGKKVILTVGRLDMRKGQDMVIRSLPVIIKEIPEVVYLIVGRGDDRERLVSIVEELSLKDHVYFAGGVHREELPLFYNLCDLFIMVSRELEETGNVEGFGIVYLEANACGKPVIAGKSGGVEDAVVDGYSGFVVNPKDPGAIQHAMLTLLKDKELALKLGRNGLERVREQFTWERASRQLYQVLKG